MELAHWGTADEFDVRCYVILSRRAILPAGLYLRASDGPR